MNKNFRYLDLSGYSFTGKSAYNNLIAEFEGFNAHAFDFEFDLLRTKDGIVDLYIALVQNWSPIRSSEAIRNFKQIIKAYGGNKSFCDKFTKIGRHYDYFFPNFTQVSQQYIDDLIAATWKGQWPFAFEKSSTLKIVLYKIIKKIGYNNIFEEEVFLSSPSKVFFINRTKQYLNEILASNMPSTSRTIVMNNVFEPFNPSLSMQFFDNVKSIIIDRDPRDIYLAALAYENKDGSKGWRATTGKNVDDFIQRFKSYRMHIVVNEDNNILRLTFEDLILKYEETLNKLFDFLGEDKSIHKYPRKYFNPDVSKKGVGMWKNVDGELKKDVEKIYFELKEYCLDF